MDTIVPGTTVLSKETPNAYENNVARAASIGSAKATAIMIAKRIIARPLTLAENLIEPPPSRFTGRQQFSAKFFTRFVEENTVDLDFIHVKYIEYLCLVPSVWTRQRLLPEVLVRDVSGKDCFIGVFERLQRPFHLGGKPFQCFLHCVKNPSFPRLFVQDPVGLEIERPRETENISISQPFDLMVWFLFNSPNSRMVFSILAVKLNSGLILPCNEIHDLKNNL